MLEFPVTSLHILRFEKVNVNISVSAHHIVNAFPRCLYKSRFPTRSITIHLLLHSNHWMPITNFNIFYKEERQSNYFKCSKCFKSFYTKQFYIQHNENQCDGDASVQHETIPDPPTLRFTDYEKTVNVPLVMYADIEAILEHVDYSDNDNTQKTRHHVAVAIGSMIISEMPSNPYHEQYVEYVGRQCMIEYIEYLERLCGEIYHWDLQYLTRIKAHRTPDEENAFKIETNCYMCGDLFETERGIIKKFDHCHVTGKYRGAACGKCNREMVHARRS